MKMDEVFDNSKPLSSILIKRLLNIIFSVFEKQVFPRGLKMMDCRANSFVFRWLLASWIGTSVLQGCFGQESTLPERKPDSSSQVSPQGDSSLRKSEPISEIVFDKPGQYGSQRRLMFSPDEQVLATWDEYSSSGFMSSVSWRENLQLWNISAGRGRVITTATEGKLESGGYAFDDQSQRFAYFDSRTCFICSAKSGEPVASVNHKDIFQTKFLADGRFLATLGYVGGNRGGLDSKEIDLKIWETGNWEESRLSLGAFRVETLFGFYHLADSGKLIFPIKDGTALECWDVIRDQRIFTIAALDEKFRKIFGEKLSWPQPHFRQPLFEVVGGTIRVTGFTSQNGIFKQAAYFEYDLENGELLSFQPPFVWPDEERAIGRWLDVPSFVRLKRLDQFGILSASFLGALNKVLEREETWEFWKASNGQNVHTIKWVESKPEITNVESESIFVVAETGTMAVSHESSELGVVNVYDSYQTPPQLVGSFATKFPVEFLALSHDRTSLATISKIRSRRPGSEYESEISVTTLPALDRQLVLEGDNAWINSITFSPDGSLLAGSAGNENASLESQGGVKIWDAKTGTVKATLPTDGKSVFSVAFRGDMKKLAAGGSESVFVWDLPTLTLEAELKLDPETTPVFDANGMKLESGLYGGFSPVRDLIFRDNGSLITSGSFHGGGSPKIVVWDLNRRSPKYMMPLGSALKNIVLHPNQNTVLGVIYIGAYSIDLVKPKILEELPKRSRLRSPDGDYYYTGHVFDVDFQAKRLIAVDHQEGYMERRGFVTIHDSDSGKVVESIATNIAEIQSLIFNGKDGLLIVGGQASHTKDSKYMTLWDLNTGRKFATIKMQSPTSYQFIEKGNLLLSRDVYQGKHHVNLWELSTGNKLTEFEHQDLNTIIVSPSENFVATVGKDSIRLWDLKQFQSNPQD